MAHVVTHDSSGFYTTGGSAYVSHEAGQDPKKDGIFHYHSDDEGENEQDAKDKAKSHAASINAKSKIKQEGRIMKTFSMFVEEINEWNAETMIKAAHDKNKKSLKGSKYTGSDDDEDGDNDSKKHEEPEVKRGRGRPAGSKSGARNKGEDGGHKDYGSYSKDH